MTDNEIIKTSDEVSCNKIKAIYPHIVVSGDVDKPYYSIQWYDIEKKTMFDGYASYKLALVKKWLQENFEATDDDIGDFINSQQAKIEAQCKAVKYYQAKAIEIKSDAIKEFADRIPQLLERYSCVHKHADEARNCTDEYPDGTTSEMTSVWEVQSLTKHGMADYETMSQLQRNIEYIAQDRLLSELEKDFRLLIKETVDAKNATTTETEHKT